MTTFTQFASRLNRCCDNIRTNVDQRCAQLTRIVHRGLLDATPVKTGWARTNWRVYTSPNGDVVPRPADVGFSYSDAINQANSTLSTSSSTYYIVNNAPYIVTLNRGSSIQAPSYFVQATIEESLSEFNNNNRGYNARIIRL